MRVSAPGATGSTGSALIRESPGAGPGHRRPDRHPGRHHPGQGGEAEGRAA